MAAWATARTVAPAQKAEPWFFALIAFLAIAPDLDFLPGLVVGEAGRYHRGPTHSFGGAVLATAAIAWATTRWSARQLPNRGRGWWFGFVGATYCAHLLLDFVMPDTRGPAGIPLFWPLHGDLVAAPLPVPGRLRDFVDLQYGNDVRSFAFALLSGHGLAVLVVEGLLFTPLLLAPRLIGRIRKKRGPGSDAGPAPWERSEM